jgi:hypothetical protein
MAVQAGPLRKLAGCLALCLAVFQQLATVRKEVGFLLAPGWPLAVAGVHSW